MRGPVELAARGQGGVSSPQKLPALSAAGFYTHPLTFFSQQQLLLVRPQ